MAILSQTDIDSYPIGSDIELDAPSTFGYQHCAQCFIAGKWVSNDFETGKQYNLDPTTGEASNDTTTHKIGIEHPFGTQVYTATIKSTNTEYNTIALPYVGEIISFGVIPDAPNEAQTFGLYTKETVVNTGTTYYLSILTNEDGTDRLFSLPAATTSNHYVVTEAFKAYTKNVYFKLSAAAATSYNMMFYVVVRPWDGILTYNLGHGFEVSNAINASEKDGSKEKQEEGSDEGMASQGKKKSKKKNGEEGESNSTYVATGIMPCVESELIAASVCLDVNTSDTIKILNLEHWTQHITTPIELFIGAVSLTKMRLKPLTIVTSGYRNKCNIRSMLVAKLDTHNRCATLVLRFKTS